MVQKDLEQDGYCSRDDIFELWLNERERPLQPLFVEVYMDVSIPSSNQAPTRWRVTYDLLWSGWCVRPGLLQRIQDCCDDISCRIISVGHALGERASVSR